MQKMVMESILLCLLAKMDTTTMLINVARFARNVVKMRLFE